MTDADRLTPHAREEAPDGKHARPRRLVSRRGIAIGLVLAVLVAGAGTAAYLLRSQPLDTKTVCMYTGADQSDLAAFSKAADSTVNCAVLYNDANPGWQQWISPWFTRPSGGGTNWSQWIKADPAQRRVVVTQEMVPDNVPANWRVLGAQGAYDQYAKKLAANLITAGMGDAVIRLGHEMNGNWYHDSLGSNPAQYKDWAAYYARIVRAMRSVPGAHFLFDWDINVGYRVIPLSSFYPGNSVVDMVGMDLYDAGMPGNPKNEKDRWDSLYHEPEGPGQIIAFARAHGKPLSIPEWGLDDSSAGGIGDDSTYVRGIASIIRDNNVVYQSYFDRPTGGVLYLQNVPPALALWKGYYGRNGTLAGKSW